MVRRVSEGVDALRELGGFMWILIETGELLNIELLNNVNPNHRERTASGYAAAVMIVADSRALYRACWPTGEFESPLVEKSARGQNEEVIG